MTEAEIAQALQARLAAPLRIAVKRRQGHLHVLLNRPPPGSSGLPPSHGAGAGGAQGVGLARLRAGHGVRA